MAETWTRRRHIKTSCRFEEPVPTGLEGMPEQQPRALCLEPTVHLMRFSYQSC